MGKTIKWFKALFGLKKQRKQSNSGDPKNKLSSCMGRSPRGYPASSPDASSPNASSSDVTPLIKPVGVGRELNRRAIAVAVATTRAADVSFVAAQAAVNYVAFTSENLNNSAAITIQSNFRGYLARKALKALKSVVKLQAIVRGFLVRKGAAETLQGMEAMFKVRSRACSQRSRLQDDKYHSKRSIRRGSESRSRRMSSSFQIPNDAGLNFVEESPQMPKSKLTRNNTWAWPADSNSRTPSPFVSYSHRYSLPNVSSHRFAYSSGPNDYESIYKQVTRDDSFTSHPGYMANTESFRAKVRSQSAPKQRVGLNKRVGPSEVASGPFMDKSKSRSPSPLLVNNFKNFIMGRIGKS
ncbi:IQ-DOMAIN 14-like protein [Tanacetum coccineum]